MESNENKKKALDVAIAEIRKRLWKGNSNEAWKIRQGASSGGDGSDRSLSLTLLWEWAECQRDELWKSMDRNPVVRQRLHCT